MEEEEGRWITRFLDSSWVILPFPLFSGHGPRQHDNASTSPFCIDNIYRRRCSRPGKWRKNIMIIKKRKVKQEEFVTRLFWKKKKKKTGVKRVKVALLWVWRRQDYFLGLSPLLYPGVEKLRLNPREPTLLFFFFFIQSSSTSRHSSHPQPLLFIPPQRSPYPTCKLIKIEPP